MQKRQTAASQASKPTRRKVATTASLPRIPAAQPADGSAAQGAAAAHETGYSIGAEIRMTYLLFKSSLQQKFRDHHVTSAQWWFLRILWDEDGLSQKALAERLGLHTTTAVPALAILERNGYICRRRDGTDKRNLFVYLTEDGRRLALALLPFAADINEHALAGLTPKEQQTLLRLLQHVQGNLRATLDAEEME